MSVGKFVDVEGLIVDWFAESIPDVRVVTVLPGQLDGAEIVRVTRSPGSNDAQTARPRIDVEAFAPDRARMWTLIGRANDALARVSGHMVANVQIDSASTITDPVSAFWSPTVQRAVAVYELDLRVF